MKYAIRCKVCGELSSVNGQKQISQFAGKHNHGSEHARITGENIDLNNTQDRITLKIDPVPLKTGKY